MPLHAGTTTAIVTITGCPECVILAGKSSCCGRGGSWQGECGFEGDPNFKHTWSEGVKVCEDENKKLGEADG